MKYFLLKGQTGETLVKAPTQSAALKHLVSLEYSARKATQDELVDCIKAGRVVVEVPNLEMQNG